MAWVNKDVAQSVRANLKVLNKKFGMKTSVQGTNSLKISVRVVSGELDFVGNLTEYFMKLHQGNIFAVDDSVLGFTNRTGELKGTEFWYSDLHYYSGACKEYLEGIKAIIDEFYWDESDSQTDYFHCSFYVSCQIGSWDKPYTCMNQA